MHRRRFALTATLAAASLIAVLAVAPAAAESPDWRPATEADLAISLSGAKAPLSATALEAEAGCGQSLPRAAVVDLAWSAGAAEGASALRVDISKFHEGFATGRFETSGVRAASLRTATVEAPEPGVRYYWRVLTRGPEGWASSEVERFRVPVCRADVLEADQAAGYLLNEDMADDAGAGQGEGR